MIATEDVDPRTRHYREFYGLSEHALEAGLVIGNCQAESLRLVIDAADTPTVRVPPVHELEPSDMPHFERLLRGASFVVTQPIRDDYRGLPVGMSQVRALLKDHARFAVVPVLRFTGLHPFQLIIRMGGRVEDPPLVPYHDVRALMRAAGLTPRQGLSADSVRATAAASVAELARREQRSGALPISDVFAAPEFDMMRTINHPGNPVFLTLGARVLEAFGAPHPPVDPGRPLLASVQAPREEWVAEAWGLTDATREGWIVDGAAVGAEVVAEAHARWYEERPEFVREALTVEADAVQAWAA
ncbi:WcbI family polysaccharide biosynthesis putative acetyltransferase [Microbacterium sp. P01]|uniref:WcbI family polysaccharide biosynthesis putative acetyltransferase n=1 Tax=Microbacterium sp. P01 TaxID=3366261 RepID=UPI00367196F6